MTTGGVRIIEWRRVALAASLASFVVGFIIGRKTR
jgi:hypothetical protein